MQDDIELLRYPIGKFVKPEHSTPQLINEWVAAIEALPNWLDICIENLDAAQIETPYRPGGWTVQQVIHHIADSHANAYIRLRLALTEDNPVVKPYKEALWAELADVQTVPVNVSVTMVHAMHRRLVALMRSMQPADWERTYFHPEHQRNVPMWEVAAMYAWHGRHHVEHIRTLRERNGW